MSQVFQQGAYLAHLLGIGLGQGAAADEQRILQPHAHMAAHARGSDRHAHLARAGAQHGPLVVLAEQLVGRALHERQVVQVGSDAPEDAQNELEEDGGLEAPRVHAEPEVVELAHVIAFVLELDAMRLQLPRRHGDVAEGVAEDIAVRLAQIGFLPIELPPFVALGQGMHGEVHAAHVERAHLGREAPRRGDALGHCIGEAAAGGEIDHGIGRGLDGGQEGLKVFRVDRNGPCPRVARVQMQYGGACLGRFDRLPCDVLGPVGQGIRHRGRVDGAGDGAGDDDLAGGLVHGAGTVGGRGAGSASSPMGARCQTSLMTVMTPFCGCGAVSSSTAPSSSRSPRRSWAPIQLG